MGWWGYNIMEGDTPLDVEGDIIEFLADPELVENAANDVPDWETAMSAMQNSAYEALKVEANVLNVFSALNAGELASYDSNIAAQVLGEMIMCSGGVSPQEVRTGCIQAAQNELDEGDTGWRDGGDGRDQCLRDYIKRVGAYVDGTPFEPTSEGLFAKMLG